MAMDQSASRCRSTHADDPDCRSIPAEYGDFTVGIAKPADGSTRLRRRARNDIGKPMFDVCGDAMRRVLLVPLATLLPLWLIAGCAGGGPLPPGPIETTEGLRASFPTGGLADTIVIDAIERLPLRGAVLIAPDGTAIAAIGIDVADSPRVATGQWMAGDPWRN